MAVWAECRDSQETAIELHFNFWCFSKKGKKDFLEIGILVDEIEKLKNIHIYYPQKINLENIVDCGPCFKEPNVAKGIFNKTLSCSIHSEEKFVDLKQDSQSSFCLVNIFDTFKIK